MTEHSGTVELPKETSAYLVRWTYDVGVRRPRKAQRRFPFGPLSMAHAKLEALRYADMKRKTANVIDVKMIFVEVCVKDITDWVEGLGDGVLDDTQAMQ